MLKNINAGWIDFEYKGFKGVFSDVYDPILEILDKLIEDVNSSKPTDISIEVDEEGTEFTISIKDKAVILERNIETDTSIDNNKTVFHEGKDAFIKELINDLYSNLDNFGEDKQYNIDKEKLESKLYNFLYNDVTARCTAEMYHIVPEGDHYLPAGSILELHSYEYYSKSEFYDVIISKLEELSDIHDRLALLIKLFNLDYPLDFLYHQWLDIDISDYEVKRQMLYDL